LVLQAWRELILQDQPFAQFTLGLAASGATPVLSLILLLTTGHTPLLGWGSIWQLIVMAVGGALATPIWFLLFEWLQGRLAHHGDLQSSFRPDREIRRGR
jgi:hypothetical protein